MTDTGQVPEGLPENAGMVDQPGIPAPGAYAFLDPADAAHGAEPAEDEEMLLMPSAQGSWSDPQLVPPAPFPQEAYAQEFSPEFPSEPAQEYPQEYAHDTGTHEAGAHETGAHEAGGRDSGAVDLSGVRLPQPAGPAAAQQQPVRRPLHMGPPVPDATGGVVRSLADRGPAAPAAQAAAAAPVAPAAMAQAAQGGPVPLRQAGPPTTGPEYLDIPRSETGVLPGPQLGEIPPQAGAPWGEEAAQAPQQVPVPPQVPQQQVPVAQPQAPAHPEAVAAPVQPEAVLPGEPVAPEPAEAPAETVVPESVPVLEQPAAEQPVAVAPVAEQQPDAVAAPAEPVPAAALPAEPVTEAAAVAEAVAVEPVPAPAEAAPAEAVVAAAEPVQPEGAHPEQVQAEGTSPDGVHPEPAQPEQVQPEAVPADAVLPEPVPAAAVPAEAGQPVPGAEPVAAAPAQPTESVPAVESVPAAEPVQPEAIPAEQFQPEQGQPQQLQPEAVQPEQLPAGAEPVAPAEPAAAEAAAPQPVAEAAPELAAVPEQTVAATAEQAVEQSAVEPPLAEPVPAAQPVAVAEAAAEAQPEPVVVLSVPLPVAPVAEAAPELPADEAGEVAAPVENAEGIEDVQHAEALPAQPAEPVAAPAAPAAEDLTQDLTEGLAEDLAEEIPAELAEEYAEEPEAEWRPAAPGYADAEREAVLRVMRERRDIRNGFRTDPIPHEVLLRVLEAAHTAPSVGHSQPWDFVVIRSAETRRTMHELATRQREAYAKSLPKGRAKQFKELKIEAILDTPVNIVVTADPTRGGRHTLGRHTQPQMAPYSSALAVENLWLAARAEGLGVGWVSFFDEREMVRALGLPEHLEVVAYLCVGYVDEFPDEPELMQAGWSKRRPLSWVVHEETYGRRALPGEEPHDLLAETVTGIRPLDAKALGEAWERQKRMTKPAGALGMLEIISAQLSGLSRVCPPPIPEPAAVAIFAGDHGVHAQGVTPWPQEVTSQMVANFLGGGAVCNAFANQVGAEVCVIDVGVAGDLPATPGLLPRKVRAGTADMTTGPAMSREEAVAAIEVGIETARDLVAAGNKALLTGEMGIANTTVSAALISVFTDTDPAEVTGRGTGINDETHARKVEVVRRALELHQPDPADPIGVLAAIGGLEHAAIVGLLLGGASLRTPVILDGVSAGAAALVARAIAPESLSACIAGHRSAEPGHVAALNKLGLRPLVDLDLRLGEGTGALLALPLVQSAARAMHEVATFDSAGVTEK
ncbi:nicotinate-nucleotide--dimethylbenzimidazole phosphoribosyltransferase [Streptomyces sp. NBC_00239]|uniref:nicotinate-nucleotide--dimethylbenzimidazole phosphoribosyltransferase n=1 Tax=Streptomyces sp. NBC_00239 TaxID=2903640 RepID=UPI002E285B72|nr:nicotinate-nucleotide--dimethylbenzimidazole phosphoribosyltransferase [Streptomyces sp. NBC_00239]